MNNARRYQDLSAAQFQAVNASCERFEQSLLRNRPVSIECELDLAPPEIQNALFDELLAIELEWQFARDRAPELSNILQRFPDRQGSVTRLFDEISNTSSQRFAHSVAAADLEQVGTIIGSYQLLEQIGSGGMGSVWRARQRKPVNREVALKLVKRGMDTQQVIARFEIERQALALMNHSNIANVFEAGSTKTGRPYFVMELVNGEKVTDYCDAHRLNTRARLMLFMSVCEAVQHAHQKGVIHRDLKPSNVLVTGSADKPIAKVIDFGLAKATGGSKLTEETLFTAVGQVVGTPTYMSPEQAQRANKDIDTRTDVYSLGVLLYETLIGETPFGSMESADTGYDNMLRRIREEDPPKMSVRVAAMGQTAQRLADRRNCSIKSLHSQLRGDLDVIVEKTLEKDRERRYQSTQEIADDIQRHLNRETIEARPASLLYRLRKSAGRNRTAFTFVALLLLSLATALSSLHSRQFVQQGQRGDCLSSW